MPGTYPAAAPTLSGDTLSISRFLQSPTSLQRRLRTFRDLRFVSDRTVEAVGAGSEYPFANLPTGTAAVAAIQKWGQKVRLTDEEILRNAYAGAAVDRSL